MMMARRLFIVPLADNDHGKTSMIRALVSQGLGQAFQVQRKGQRNLVTPWGRTIDAYVFGRSYQEVEKTRFGSVVDALDGNDPNWRKRELIIMPSHLTDIFNQGQLDDIDEMIAAAHSGGFDIICATVIFTGDEEQAEDPVEFSTVWGKSWDERWTVPNPWNESAEGQLDALGRDLWTWVAKAITRQ